MGGMQAALDAFADENGMRIIYTGLRDFDAQIGTLVAGGAPPDIAMLPQPGKLAGFARNGDALPLPDDVVAAVSENWSADWMGFGNVDGTQFGVPAKSDLKSLVWYVPSAFAEKGYEVPTTLDDFLALTEEMAANGDTPLCVGIESSAATGWPFTDWVEDLVLRNYGVDFYNQWVTHEVPVQLARNRRDVPTGRRPVERRGHDVRVRWLHRLDELPGQRRTAGQRRLHDAPSGELLRRHRRAVRRVRRRGRPVQLLLLPVERRTASPHRWIGSWRVPRRTRGLGRDAVPRLA